MSNERRQPEDLTDAIVSTAYREFSTERTPAHLDHAVLNEARNAAKQRHRSAMAWLRPAAWIATVGLCLALVIEVADLPMQEQGVFDEAAETRGETSPGGTLENQAPRDGAPAPIEVDADADRVFLREAEDRARLKAGSDEIREDSVQDGSAIGATSDVAAEAYCSDGQRADPNDWLACILELEARGMPEAAMLERELLQEAFPKFYAAPDIPR